MPTPKLSIVAPVYNEAEGILHFIKSVQAVCAQHYPDYELILIDDGSNDDSLRLMRQAATEDSNIRILVFSRNYGHDIAMTAGMEHSNGEWIVLMDSDMQNPPELIPQLMGKAMQGYDVVFAQRNKRVGESWLKKITSKLFYFVARKMTGFDLPDNASDFRVLSKRVAQSICELKENDRYLMMLYAYVGFKTTSVPYNCPPRFAGKTKYNYLKMIDLGLDAIIGFSRHPLRLMSILSVVISICAFGYTTFIIIQRLLVNNFVDGMASVLCMVSGFFAVLFLFLAIISEYIGRILTESKNRPLYYLQENISKRDRSD